MHQRAWLAPATAFSQTDAPSPFVNHCGARSRPAGPPVVRERDRADKLMAELLKATSHLMSAKESAARLDGELAALKARPWWKRIAG